MKDVSFFQTIKIFYKFNGFFTVGQSSVLWVMNTIKTLMMYFVLTTWLVESYNVEKLSALKAEISDWATEAFHSQGPCINHMRGGVNPRGH